MSRQIILDTETTGLETKDGHRLIEIGCVEMLNRQLTGNNFHYYVQPDREIDAEAMAVHGITNEFLRDKPRFTDIAPALLEYLSGAELIIHNAPLRYWLYQLRIAVARRGSRPDYRLLQRH